MALGEDKLFKTFSFTKGFDLGEVRHVQFIFGKVMLLERRLIMRVDRKSVSTYTTSYCAKRTQVHSKT